MRVRQWEVSVIFKMIRADRKRIHSMCTYDSVSAVIGAEAKQNAVCLSDTKTSPTNTVCVSVCASQGFS